MSFSTSLTLYLLGIKFLIVKVLRGTMMSELTGLLPHVKFQFDVNHPTLEECYLYGYECALANVDEEQNPYLASSKEGEQWLEGWWAGFYGETPLFDWDKDVVSYEKPHFNAENDQHFHDSKESYFTRVLEIAGVIAVSAILGYQVFDLVA